MRFCVALFFASLVPACTPNPGVDLHVIVPDQVVGPAAKMVITAIAAGNVPLGMNDTSANGVDVHTDAAGRVTLTFNTPGFTIRDAFDILLVPTTRTPVTVAFTGKLYQADDQLLASATQSETVAASLTQRKMVTVSFHCMTTACTAVPPGETIDLASPPATPTIFDWAGASGGDKLQPIAVGRLLAGSGGGDDLIVAAPTKSVIVGSNSYANAGAVYVLSGQDWTVPDLEPIKVANADLIIVGKEGDGLGSAAAIGDFDGDGADDLAVAGVTASRPGTPPPNGSYAAAGVVYVFTARRMQMAGRVIDLNDAATYQATPRIYGSNGQEKLGSALTFGHLSSKTFADLIVGAPGATGSGGASKAGRVYVVAGFDPGAVGNLLVQTTDPPVSGSGAQSVTLLGATPNTPIGQALAAADLGGDPNKVELAIGNYLDGGKGSVKIFTGEHLTSSSTIDLGSQAADATVLGTSGSQLGWSVAFGDVEGTGSRMLIATSRANGVVYTFPTMLTGATLDVGQGQFRLALVGPKGASFGSSMALANLDGDAALDLLIGAPGSSGLDGTRTASGAVFVVTGAQMSSWATAAASNTIVLAQKAPALTIYGAQKSDSLGNHVTAGNLDISTKTSELVLGADSGGMNAQGEVYAIQSLPPP